MGKTLTPVAFFVDAIKIEPHSATDAKWLGRKVSIRQFAKGRPVSLERIEETGEFVVSAGLHEWMQGPEV